MSIDANFISYLYVLHCAIDVSKKLFAEFEKISREIKQWPVKRQDWNGNYFTREMKNSSKIFKYLHYKHLFKTENVLMTGGWNTINTGEKQGTIEKELELK